MRTKLIQYRENKGLSKRQCALLIGTNAQNYAYIENNKRIGSIDMWKKIQEALDIPSADMWTVIAENSWLPINIFFSY